MRTKSVFNLFISQTLGGHTKEMLTLLTGLSSCYYPRIYIVANTDNMTTEKIKNFENDKVTESYYCHTQF